jgi:hypothetical protein
MEEHTEGTAALLRGFLGSAAAPAETTMTPPPG